MFHMCGFLVVSSSILKNEMNFSLFSFRLSTFFGNFQFSAFRFDYIWERGNETIYFHQMKYFFSTFFTIYVSMYRIV